MTIVVVLSVIDKPIKYAIGPNCHAQIYRSMEGYNLNQKLIDR